MTRSDLLLLNALAEAGGSADLDQFGRLIVVARALPGHPQAWFGLVAKGYVGGEYGKLILTEAGRAELLRRS